MSAGTCKPSTAEAKIGRLPQRLVFQPETNE